MLAAARAGKFGILVVWRSDRLFRSLRHMVMTLDELTALNIAFVSVCEPFDTTTPQGRLLLHLLSSFAEFERHLLIERTCAGLEATRRRGTRLGRPPTQLDLQQARTLREAGASIRTVARTLGVSATTVHRALNRERVNDAS